MLIEVLLACALFASPGIFQRLDYAIKEAFHEANTYLVKKGLDVVDIPASESRSPLYKFQILGGQAGNFSTAHLIDEPIVSQTYTGPKVTQMSVDLNIKLNTFYMRINFKNKLLLVFVSSGTVDIRLPDNVIHNVLSIRKYNDSQCEVEVENVEVSGTAYLNIEPSGLFNWIMGTVVQFFMRIATILSTPTINDTFLNIFQQSKVKEMMEDLICKHL